MSLRTSSSVPRTSRVLMMSISFSDGVVRSDDVVQGSEIVACVLIMSLCVLPMPSG